jgi:hypothetical protein
LRLREEKINNSRPRRSERANVRASERASERATDRPNDVDVRDYRCARMADATSAGATAPRTYARGYVDLVGVSRTGRPDRPDRPRRRGRPIRSSADPTRDFLLTVRWRRLRSHPRALHSDSQVRHLSHTPEQPPRTPTPPQPYRTEPNPTQGREYRLHPTHPHLALSASLSVSTTTIILCKLFPNACLALSDLFYRNIPPTSNIDSPIN